MEARQPFFRRPGVQVLVVSLLVLLVYLWLVSLDTPGLKLLDIIKGIVKLFLGMFGRIPDAVYVIFLDVLIFVASFFIWLGFFSQFSMPVRSLAERALAWLYMGFYCFRAFGLNRLGIGRNVAVPIQVQNGTPLRADAQDLRNGWGVMLFDTASAALLRNAVAFTRTVGPGLVFSRRGEFLAGTVDLHRQNYPSPGLPLGPREAENPFEPRKKDKEGKFTESEEAYNLRQERRRETSALTRDGVEVVPNIFVAFRLDPDLRATDPELLRHEHHPSHAVQTNFNLSHEAVRRAVSSEAINPCAQEPEKRYIPWNRLPATLAVDMWREYMRRFTLEELFTPVDDPAFPDMTAFEVIQRMVRERLSQPRVLALTPEGRSIQSPGGQSLRHPRRGMVRDTNGQILRFEYVDFYEHQVLQTRGVKVLYVPIRNLHLPPNVDQQIADQWFAYWLWRARDEREYVDRLRA